MTPEPSETVVVSLPERVDRPLRLGPFPSARAALKFVGFAAVGALFIPSVGVWAWFPFLGVGLFVSLYQEDGRSPDRRVSDYLHYRLRSRRARSTARPAVPGTGAREVAPGPTPTHAPAIIETQGIPVAHLPREELLRVFAAYRELLRSWDGGFELLVTIEPVDPGPLRPTERPTGSPEDGARAGYDELVALVCRRRFVRRVFVVLGPPTTVAAGGRRGEGRLRPILRGLTALGVEPRLLRGPERAPALERLGWDAP